MTSTELSEAQKQMCQDKLGTGLLFVRNGVDYSNKIQINAVLQSRNIGCGITPFVWESTYTPVGTKK